MERTVYITAVRTVTIPGDVTDLQGSVSEGVKQDGQDLYVIKVMSYSKTLHTTAYISIKFNSRLGLQR